MDCKKMAKKLNEFLDRELDEKERLDFQSHLAACEACFSRCEFEKILRISVKKGLTQTMPAGLKNKVRQAIRAESKCAPKVAAKKK